MCEVHGRILHRVGIERLAEGYELANKGSNRSKRKQLWVGVARQSAQVGRGQDCMARYTNSKQFPTDQGGHSQLQSLCLGNDRSRRCQQQNNDDCLRPARLCFGRRSNGVGEFLIGSTNLNSRPRISLRPNTLVSVAKLDSANNNARDTRGIFCEVEALTWISTSAPLFSPQINTST